MGLQFAQDVGIHEFCLEGDSLVISNALKEQSPPSSSVAQVVYGINDVYHILDFRRAEIFHVCRQGNKPAHFLAKCLGMVDFSTWIEKSPYFLEQTLLHDGFLTFNCE